MVDPATIAKKTVLVGRFALEVPASMVRSGGEYRIRRVSVREEIWTKGLEGAADLAWKEKLARIEALKKQRRFPEDPLGEILETRTFRPPELRGVLYHKQGIREDATWEALLDLGDTGLWLSAEGDTDRSEPIAKKLEEVAAAYRRLPDLDPAVPIEGGFHIGNGAVVLPFLEMEEASADFADQTRGLDLHVRFETVSTPKEPGLLERLSSMFGIASEMKVGLDRIRTGRREAGGMKGEEAILRPSDPKDQRILFEWMFPGEALSFRRPRARVNMQAEGAGGEKKIPLWDAVLGSVKPLP